MTTSARRAASAGVRAAVAPSATSGVTFSRILFQTVTSWPAEMRRPAMRLPMAPSPMTATLLTLGKFHTQRSAAARASRSDQKRISEHLLVYRVTTRRASKPLSDWLPLGLHSLLREEAMPSPGSGGCRGAQIPSGGRRSHEPGRFGGSSAQEPLQDRPRDRPHDGEPLLRPRARLPEARRSPSPGGRARGGHGERGRGREVPQGAPAPGGGRSM